MEKTIIADLRNQELVSLGSPAFPCFVLTYTVLALGEKYRDGFRIEQRSPVITYSNTQTISASQMSFFSKMHSFLYTKSA